MWLEWRCGLVNDVIEARMILGWSLGMGCLGVPLPRWGRSRGREGDDLDNAKNKGWIYLCVATEVMRVET